MGCHPTKIGLELLSRVRSGGKIHRRTFQKDLTDLDNHDGIITNLEPDILECEIKWALGNSTKNNISGGDRIPAELFQIHMTDFPKKDILLVDPRQSPCNN